ncbi:MAG: hypothetical protein V4850_14935 [Myxococcota bacterium]
MTPYAAWTLLLDSSEAEVMSDLAGSLRRLAGRVGVAQAQDVAVIVLRAELGRLDWPPAVGTAFLHAALSLGAPPDALVVGACEYLWLYYQELDDVLAACRAGRAEGVALAELGGRLTTAIEGLER